MVEHKQLQYSLGALTARLDTRSADNEVSANEKYREVEQQLLGLLREIRESETLTEEDYGIRINARD